MLKVEKPARSDKRCSLQTPFLTRGDFYKVFVDQVKMGGPVVDKEITFSMA